MYEYLTAAVGSLAWEPEESWKSRGCTVWLVLLYPRVPWVCPGSDWVSSLFSALPESQTPGAQRVSGFAAGDRVGVKCPSARAATSTVLSI